MIWFLNLLSANVFAFLASNLVEPLVSETDAPAAIADCVNPPPLDTLSPPCTPPYLFIKSNSNCVCCGKLVLVLVKSNSSACNRDNSATRFESIPAPYLSPILAIISPPNPA
uniref:Uncharacterized protein n=1 Tax=uncultured marine virus TaxID=186617 RepID=A0A0F7LAS0_9VIRU|nr:hypothetical protein [uncultured marine virus]